MKSILSCLICMLLLTGCARLSFEAKETSISYWSFGKRELKDLQIVKAGDIWSASMAQGTSQDSVPLEDIVKTLGVLK